MFSFFSGPLFATSGGGEDEKFKQPPIRIKKTHSKVTIDGVLDEAIWQKSVSASDFWEYFPSDTLKAEWQTEIFMAYDDDFLYIAAKNYSQTDQYVAQSLRRDFSANGNDHIAFVIDPFNDYNNAFMFGITPFGVVREGLISGGGRDFRRGWDISWENKWYGKASVQDGYWVCEIAIPFSTLKFSEGSKEWNFNAYRFDTDSGIQSTWTRIPLNQSIINLSFMGKMQFDEPLQKPGKVISVLPYTIGGVNYDFDSNSENPQNGNFNFGGDIKMGISSGLNLDLTINPDFSQVEVDRQVTNLGRFELFFPERRQFFLENADLFGSFGDSRINPFFSRRIGIKSGESVTILGGARLSGKVNDNLRIGVLNMQTAEESDLENPEPSFNYTVAALQRKVGRNSNVGVIFVNKQTFEDLDESTFDVNEFNRVVGVDYNLGSANNRISGKTFLHHSISTESTRQPFAHGLNFNYRTNSMSVEWDHQWVGEEYNAEVGFVPRKNFFRINPEVRWSFFPKNPKINQHGPWVGARIYWLPEIGRSDHEYNLGYRFSFRNSSRLWVNVENNFVYLFNSFNPTRKGEVELAADTEYNYTTFSGSYRSDNRKSWFYEIRPTVGGFFNGHRYGLQGTLTYRYQPYGSISINLNYNHIDLPRPFAPTNLLLIGPKIDLTFTKSLFLTTFIQYNNQIDNINVNTRFQWRFAPQSDLFIVYTDNYYATDFNVKSRALVAKFTYWLNL